MNSCHFGNICSLLLFFFSFFFFSFLILIRGHLSYLSQTQTHNFPPQLTEIIAVKKMNMEYSVFMIPLL